MADISTSADVMLLVDSFYKKAISDEVIGHFFTEVVQLDFDVHMPRMYAFWESVLFGKPGFEGNPMVKHIDLHQLSPLERRHFDRWLELWERTVNESFSGVKADLAVSRARNIVSVMEMKVSTSTP